jgi:hypothetical protein
LTHASVEALAGCCPWLQVLDMKGIVTEQCVDIIIGPKGPSSPTVGPSSMAPQSPTSSLPPFPHLHTFNAMQSEGITLANMCLLLSKCKSLRRLLVGECKSLAAVEPSVLQDVRTMFASIYISTDPDDLYAIDWDVCSFLQETI